MRHIRVPATILRIGRDQPAEQGFGNCGEPTIHCDTTITHRSLLAAPNGHSDFQEPGEGNTPLGGSHLLANLGAAASCR